MPATQTEMLFNRKDQARTVNRRLRDYNVLSRVVSGQRGATLVIEVPTNKTSQGVWELAQRIHQGLA